MAISVVVGNNSIAWGQPERQPSVLLILSDDQGWGDIHSHGNDRLETPHLDRLAESGARFDRFLVSPFSSATRACLLTGRCHLRGGVWGTTRGQENLRAQEITLGELFQNAGYQTGYFGKWHNGAHYPMHPNGQGFEEFLGFCGDHWSNYFDAALERNGEPIRTTGYITDVLTDAAMAFVSRHARQPFFCMVAYNVPHSPWQVPDEYFAKYKSKGCDDTTACAYGMIDNLDENVGRLLKSLESLELLSNTIVVFVTDNGPNSDRFNGEMRGRKGSVHEGGVRVPCFVSFPAQIRAGLEISLPTAAEDMFATLAHLSGISLPNELKLDGRDLTPLLEEQSKDWPDRNIYTFSGKGERGAVRTQQWRAVFEKSQWELFDMSVDPGERKDVANAHRDVVAKLSRAYDAHLKEVSKGGFDTIPIPIGHPECETVTLPAHEATLHWNGKNGIRYFGENGWTNDWVSHWTDTNAYPFWEVDVVRAGEYELSLIYCCPQENIGCEFQVEIGDVELAGTITEAHDPPIAKSPDRVPRTETYDREWTTLSLGTVKLPAGRARLILRALEKPGRQMAEIKAVRMVRQ